MTASAQKRRIGPYRIVRLLGEGGMGSVYEARHEPLERRVAVKTLHPEYARDQDAVARFFKEAKVLSRLEHPSIVQASDFGYASDGTAYLVMEYLRGESLASRLSGLSTSGKQLPILTVLQFAWQVADVLAVAHSQGIVHRDIKPENLMLVADPVAPGGERVKILDFGIAKLLQDPDSRYGKTNTHALIGTPAYMSPEQCAGAGGVDAQTDVYSLGCVLYEVISGQTPFIADGGGQLIGMHLFQSIPPLKSLQPNTPEAITDLIHRLLAKDKAQRPSMSEAADSFGLLLGAFAGSPPVVRSALPTQINVDERPNPTRFSSGTTLGQSNGQPTIGSNRTFRASLVAVTALMFVVSAAVFVRRFQRSQTAGHLASMTVMAAVQPANQLPDGGPTIDAGSQKSPPASPVAQRNQQSGAPKGHINNAAPTPAKAQKLPAPDHRSRIGYED